MTHKQQNPQKRIKLKKGKRLVAKPVAAAPSNVVQMSQVPERATFQRVIDITSKPFDAQKVAVALAKEHPEIFLKLVEATTVVVDWHRDVVTLAYQSAAVSAIKLIRERTGFGLKEAKDVYDMLRSFMSQAGYMIGTRDATVYTVALSSQQKAVYDQLCVSARNLK
jgi:ribosomal protein L7/L12